MATIIVLIEVPDTSREDILKRGMIVFDKQSERYFAELDLQYARTNKDGKLYLPLRVMTDGAETTSMDWNGDLMVEIDQIVLGRVKKKYIPKVVLK